MKKFSLKRASVPSDQNRNALRGGSYSLVVTAIVLAILIAVNVFASALPKSMTNYLSISSSTASLLKVLMIGAFPLAYLGIGVGVVLTRRRKQNEAV